MNQEIIYIIVSSIYGAIVGSFLNVVILRLPHEDKSIVFPASHCPVCQENLSWYENIPLFSYIFLLGRCRHCKTKISMQYPVVELCTAMLAAALFQQFGLSWNFLVYFIFCSALVVIIWIDIHHQIIPDSISLPGIILGFIYSFFNPLITWQDSLIGITVGGGILIAISVLYYLLRKQEGMGGGDVKLLAMLGAFLGWQSLPFIIFASSLTGSIVGLVEMVKQKKGGATRIPFGPFLSLAGIAYLFFSQEIKYLFMLYMSGQW